MLFCLLLAEKWIPQLHVIVFFNIIYFFDDPWHCLALRILFHFTSSNGAVDIIFHHSSKRGRESCIMPIIQCLLQYQSHSRQLFAWAVTPHPPSLTPPLMTPSSPCHHLSRICLLTLLEEKGGASLLI